MPIWTAIKNSGRQAAHPLFVQRGIGEFTHATLNELHFAALATSTEIAYGAYKDNIDIFVAATYFGKRMHTYETGVDMTTEDLVDIPFGYPPVSFDFREPIKEDVRDKFMEKYADSKVAYEPVQRTKLMVAHTPTLAFLKRLPKFAKLEGPCRMDTCEPISIPWASFMWRVIDSFLRTNSYPAYMSNEGSMQLCLRLAREATSVEVNAENATAYRMRYYHALGTDMPFSQEAPPFSIEHNHVSGWSIEDTVLHAKPSHHPVTENLGGPSAVPNLPGCLLPYFPGMILSDKTFARKIMSSYFLRLFGGSTAAVKDGYSQFRHQVDTFLSTSVGLYFCHILFGIDLALKTQTRLYVIVEQKSYHGFVLLGARFNIHDGVKWHAPLEEVALRAELNALGTHESAIVALTTAMNGLKLMASPRVAQPFLPTTVTSPTVLADMLLSVEWTESALKIAETHLTALAFGGKYRQVNLENLQWALSMLCDPLRALPGDMLFYIPSKGFEQLAIRDYRIFAAFGPASFSLMNTKGQKFSIAKPDVTDPLDIVDPKTQEKALPHLLISFKPVSVCVQDWMKMKKERIVQMDLKERAQAHRNFILKGGARDNLMKTLKEEFAKLKVQDKKRKPDEDANMAGPSKRKRAAAEDVEFSLFSDDEEL